MQPKKKNREILLSSIKLVELYIDKSTHKLPDDKARKPFLSSVKWLAV